MFVTKHGGVTPMDLCWGITTVGRDVTCWTAMGRVSQWLGRGGTCRACLGARPLTSIGQARPGPASPTPHFYRQGPGQPGLQPLTLIDSAQASPSTQPVWRPARLALASS